MFEGPRIFPYGYTEIVFGSTLHDMMGRAEEQDWDALGMIEHVLGRLPAEYSKLNRWGGLEHVVISYKGAKRALHHDWPTNRGGGTSVYKTRLAVKEQRCFS